MIVIEWFRKPGEGELFRFDRSEITLGGSPRNDLVLEGRGLLKKHCTISRGPDGHFQLTSMSSKDAAVVNGHRCFRGELRPGDRILIGTSTLVFRGESEEAPTPPLPAPPPSPARPAAIEPREGVVAPVSPERGGVRPADGEHAEAPESTAAPSSKSSRSRRGRRPIEVVELPMPGGSRAVRRELRALFQRRLAATETVRGVIELLSRRLRGGEVLLFSHEEDELLHLVDSSRSERSFVFSRKALARVLADGRPVSTREGERVAAYFPLVAEKGRVRGFLVVRGSLSDVDSELVEEAAFLLALRIGELPREGRAATRSTGPAPIEGVVFDAETGALSEESDDLKVITEAVERRVIDRVLARMKGNQSKAAVVLNISRGSLISKLKQYGLPDHRGGRGRR
jgi:pSer/pThr/pTyr-binding forkhead associated (FHA) protein